MYLGLLDFRQFHSFTIDIFSLSLVSVGFPLRTSIASNRNSKTLSSGSRQYDARIVQSNLNSQEIA